MSPAVDSTALIAGGCAGSALIPIGARVHSPALVIAGCAALALAGIAVYWLCQRWTPPADDDDGGDPREPVGPSPDAPSGGLKPDELDEIERTFLGLELDASPADLSMPERYGTPVG